MSWGRSASFGWPQRPPPTSHGHLPPLRRELIEMEDEPASSRGHPSGLTVKCKITTPTEEDPAPLCPVQGLSTAIQISHLGKGAPSALPRTRNLGKTYVGHWRQPPPPACLSAPRCRGPPQTPPRELSCMPQPHIWSPGHSCRHPRPSWDCPKLCLAPIPALSPKWETQMPGKPSQGRWKRTWENVVRKNTFFLPYRSSDPGRIRWSMIFSPPGPRPGQERRGEGSTGWG